MFAELSKELLHLILWYTTSTYQGLIQFRQVCKDWKNAAESSSIWLTCDLTFYCPKEYLLLRKKHLKIINDILLFIEWSAFIGANAYQIHLFQPVVYQECIKVIVINRYYVTQKHEYQDEKLAKSVSTWFIKVMVSYYRWWERCIFYRRWIDYCYSFLASDCLPLLIPFFLGISCLCFVFAIYGLNDLEQNLRREWSLSHWNIWGFYSLYGYLGIFLFLSLTKEWWKKLYLSPVPPSPLPQIMNSLPLLTALSPSPLALLPPIPTISTSQIVLENSLSSNPPSPIPQTLTPFQSLSLFRTVRSESDGVLIGLFCCVLLGVSYLQYKIQTEASSYPPSLPLLLDEEEVEEVAIKVISPSSSFPLYWSYGMIPFWAWSLFSFLRLLLRYYRQQQQEQEASIHFTPILQLVILFVFLVGSLSTILLLYLDNIVSLRWYQWSLVGMSLLNILWSLLLMQCLNYFLFVLQNIDQYPILERRLLQQIGLFLLVMICLFLMLLSSSGLMLEEWMDWKILSANEAETEGREGGSHRRFSFITCLVMYVFGFHGLMMVKLIDEIWNQQEAPPAAVS